MSTEHCHDDTGGFSVGRNLKITVAIFAAIFLLSYAPVLRPLHESLVDYLALIALPVLLGLIVGGVIDYFVPDHLVFRYLGQRKKTALLAATGLGVLLSACSHGILAIAIELYKKGAGIPAVITFLLASPWANLPVTILLFGIFGWSALLFILAAMLIALLSGYAFTLLEDRGLIEAPRQPVSSDPVAANRPAVRLRDSMRGVALGSLRLANMVLWWILIGVLIAALIGAYVPHHIFMDFFGPGIFGLLATLGVATVIEVCSEGSAPIAFELYEQIGTLGNPFVFLMAGVVTDYTEIGLLWTNIGKRTALWLPVITVPQVLLVGFLMNHFLGAAL